MRGAPAWRRALQRLVHGVAPLFAFLLFELFEIAVFRPTNHAPIDDLNGRSAGRCQNQHERERRFRHLFFGALGPHPQTPAIL